MQQKRFFYDVRSFREQYSSIIDPVGQLVEIEPRIRSNPIVQRFCTGFNFNSEGYFLTAGHCLSRGNPCSPLNAQFTENCRVSFGNENGNQFEFLYPISSVLDQGSCVQTWTGGDSIDYAVLKLNEEVSSKFSYIRPIKNVPFLSGSQVIAVSHPNGDPKKISFGTLQSFNRLMDHTARIEPGSSGSPLTCQIERHGFFANGVNVSVSVDPRGEQDHQHYYALPMSEIAKKSATVNRNSFFLAPRTESETLGKNFHNSLAGLGRYR